MVNLKQTLSTLQTYENLQSLIVTPDLYIGDDHQKLDLSSWLHLHCLTLNIYNAFNENNVEKACAMVIVAKEPIKFIYQINYDFS